MKILLDTNIVIMLIDGGTRLSPATLDMLFDPEQSLVTSVISLWEIAIKTRTGKLVMVISPDQLAAKLTDLGIETLPLAPEHAVADPQLPPALKDPFDRMFVAVAEYEQIPYLTTDTKLLDHPLAWRP